MKKTIILLLLNALCITSKAQSNIGTAAAAVVTAGATIASAAIAYDRIVESCEREMVEWVLQNKNLDKKDKFELSLFSFDATKKSELSNVRVIPFYFKRKGKPKEILLNVLSPNWVNENGLKYTKTRVYTIDKNYFRKLMQAYINLAKPNDLKYQINIDSIPTTGFLFKDKLDDFSKIVNISKNLIEFENSHVFTFEKNISGDIHIIEDFDEDFMIDFNEGHLNLFIKQTGELIKIKRDFLTSMCLEFFKKEKFNL